MEVELRDLTELTGRSLRITGGEREKMEGEERAEKERRERR